MVGRPQTSQEELNKLLERKLAYNEPTVSLACVADKTKTPV